jgi:hypothetical protein
LALSARAMIIDTNLPSLKAGSAKENEEPFDGYLDG